MSDQKPPPPVHLSIPEAQLQTLIGAAIYEHLNEETKKTIMSAAIAHIVQPPTDNYGSRRGDSPIQAAFKAAADRVSTKIVHELLEDPNGPYRAQIQEVVQGALDKLLSDKPKLIDKLADDFAGAIRNYIFRDSR